MITRLAANDQCRDALLPKLRSGEVRGVAIGTAEEVV